MRAGASYNYLLVNGIRRPSARELLRLQGFPEHFEIAVNIAQLRKQTGNSVAIPVIRAIAENMREALRPRKRPEPSVEQLDLLGDSVLRRLENEIKVEFPSTTEFDEFFEARGYDQLPHADRTPRTKIARTGQRNAGIAIEIG